MPSNDIIVLNAHYKNWQTARANGIDAPFVYYCAEQFLKPHDPTDEDIQYGITDGPDDGGVDAIYFIADRNEFIRDDTELGPRRPTSARLVIMQTKEAESGFKMIEIDKLCLFSEDLLDLSKSADDPPIASKYHMRLREIMQTFKDKYLLFTTSQFHLSIDYFYITKGDRITPDKKALNSIDRVKEIAHRHMNKATIGFHCVNAQELLEQGHVRISKDKDLHWACQPMTTEDGILGIVLLKDFYEFLKDSDGSLAERLFEANVRGFQQNTAVNRQIRTSLGSPEGVNFWLLNNGITIIAEKTQSAGHLQITCRDPQIVNGLQSSRAIFEYFSETAGASADSRSILVRLIETNDEKARDSVIRATNSQNKMEAASLRSTDPIHHEIEEIMKQFGLYYDRRKGHYKDQGFPARRIVSVMELTKAVIAIVAQRPDDARGRAGNYLRNEVQYKEVFGEWSQETGWVDMMPLPAYVTCVKITRMVQSFLKEEATNRNEFRGHEHNLRFHVALAVACSALESGNPDREPLASLRVSLIAKELVRECTERVWRLYSELGATDNVAKGPELKDRLLGHIQKHYGDSISVE